MCECVSGLCPAMFLTGLLFFLPSFLFFSRPGVETTLEGEMGNGSTCAFLLGSWIPGGLWLGRDLKIMGIGGDGSWIDGGMDGWLRCIFAGSVGISELSPLGNKISCGTVFHSHFIFELFPPIF